MTITCRLDRLLEEKHVTVEALALASGIPGERILAYCDSTLDYVSLREIGAIMSVLGCTELSDFFAQTPDEGELPESDDMPPIMEAEWYTPCPDALDGRHHWYKDTDVSDSIYQEFVCRACRRRLSVIL
ncbi:MAG: helix-turn-helix transcriptional regulator [Clostridia bacterium]|nr:helix-turn-helix transcriptional regulator [Clostridia bacterium]